VTVYTSKLEIYSLLECDTVRSGGNFTDISDELILSFREESSSFLLIFSASTLRKLNSPPDNEIFSSYRAATR